MRHFLNQLLLRQMLESVRDKQKKKKIKNIIKRINVRIPTVDPKVCTRFTPQDHTSTRITEMRKATLEAIVIA